MTATTADREKIIEALNDATRDGSTWTVLFHSAIAEDVGLNITDHKCLDILFQRGPLTAGELSEITGLTTGAITGVIDRLEKHGFASRVRDPSDRRKVIVQANAERALEDLGPLFDHFLQRYTPLLDQYSDDDLRLILRYYKESLVFLQQEIAWLKERRKKREAAGNR
jgi:DNA-binding MarR family transcriptional regulator